MGLPDKQTQYLVLEGRGYGAMAIIVKPFFVVFSSKKHNIYQIDRRLSAEIS
jgi:hypothetical protein